MSTPKSIRDARAALKAAKATVATLDATAQELKDRQAAALAKANPARKRLARIRVITKRPGDQYALTTAATIAPYGYAPEGIADGESIAKYAKRLSEGNAKIVIHGGQGFSPKSLPMKVRTLTKADERLVLRANAKRARAQAALNRADTELTRTLVDVFGRSDKMAIDAVARDVAQIAHAGRTAAGIRGEWSATNDRWRAERAVEDGAVHLAWAESRTKDPCICGRCANERRNKQRAIEQAAAEKKRAREEAAERRRIARLPRREFVCPTALSLEANGLGYEDPHEAEPDADGKVWVTSPVFTNDDKSKYVECPDCESAFGLATVLSRPVGKSPGQQELIAA